MIQHIISQNQKDEWREKNRVRTKVYTITFVGVLILSACIAILPLRLNWISSTNTEPQEAVVRIETETGMGTGFLISPYQILTARHVVEEISLNNTVQISFDQTKFPRTLSATVVAFNTTNSNDLSSDVALLELQEEVNDIAPLELGNSDEFKTGQVVIMGYGLDDWSEPDGKITSDSFHGNNNLYKIDASGAQPGHSGSPVVIYEDGIPTKVIGIYVADFNTVQTALSGRLTTGEGVGVKINKAVETLSAIGYTIR